MPISQSFATLLVIATTSVACAADKVNSSCAASNPGAPSIHIHGRLGLYDGGYPNLRLWPIGSHHLFGIYGDANDLRCTRASVRACDGDQDTLLPKNVDTLLRIPDPLFFDYRIYGEFRIRPLEVHTPGAMQAACIVSASHLVRRKD